MAEIDNQLDASQVLRVLESNSELLRELLNKVSTKRTHYHVCGSMTQKGTSCKVAVKEVGDRCRHHDESISEKEKCTGHKKNGDPCGNPQPKGSNRCHFHKERYMENLKDLFFLHQWIIRECIEEMYHL